MDTPLLKFLREKKALKAQKQALKADAKKAKRERELEREKERIKLEKLKRERLRQKEKEERRRKERDEEERRRVRAGHAVTSSNKGERVYNKDRPDVHVYRPGRGGGKPFVPEHGTITIQQRPTSAPTNKTVVPPANKSAVEEMPSAKQSTPRGKGSASRVRAGRGRGAPALQGQQLR